MWPKAGTIALIALGWGAITACGGHSSGTGRDAPAGTHDDGANSTPDAPAGANTISGTVVSGTFDTVGAVYWIGTPDSPSTDTVIYMFDKSVGCGDITQAGWDTRIASGTQILEMKMVGQTPMAYPTTTTASHVPRAGESLSSYTVAGNGATDRISNGGSVTLTTIGQPTAGQFASGTFDLTFPGGSLRGMYDAPYCQAGREP